MKHTTQLKYNLNEKDYTQIEERLKRSNK